jgi:hypothetical protein
MGEMIVRRHYDNLRLSRHLVFNHQTPHSREPETSAIQWQLIKAKDIVTATTTNTPLKLFPFLGLFPFHLRPAPFRARRMGEKIESPQNFATLYQISSAWRVHLFFLLSSFSFGPQIPF